MSDLSPLAKELYENFLDAQEQHYAFHELFNHPKIKDEEGYEAMMEIIDKGYCYYNTETYNFRFLDEKIDKK